MMHATKSRMKRHDFTLPSLPIQQSVVPDLEVEVSLVMANRELIQLLKQKITNAIAHVWIDEWNSLILASED